MNHREYTAALATAALVWTLAAPDVRAQSGGSTTAAEALFAEGRALMKRGEYAAACDKFAASHEIEPSVGALLNLGDCRDNNGQSATAWTTFRQAAAEARKAGDRKRERYALSRAGKLEPTLSYLVIDVPDDHRVAGLSITREGEPVPDAMWGQPVPADPGAYRIRARAPGHRDHDLEVTVPRVTGRGRSAEARRVAVTIPRLEREPRTPREPGGAERSVRRPDTGAGVRIPDRDDAGPRDGGMPGRRVLAIAVGAVGAAGLAAGGVFGVRARSAWSQAQDGHCDADNTCDPEGLALAADARSLGNTANLAFLGAGVTLVAAAVLWLTAPDSSPGPRDRERRAARITPRLAPDAVGLDLAVRF